MANWALPSLISTYTNFLLEVTARDTSCATWFDSATNTDTNLTVGTVRWNSTNNNWEKWSGTVWGALTATYGISITGYSSSLVGGNNTTLLGAIPYQSNVNTSTLLNPNTTTTKQFLTQTGTGTNGAAPVWGTIGVADITGAAPIASPTFTGTPTLPTGTIAVTQTVGNNTTAIATTAFVLANGISLSASMPLIASGTGVIGVATAAAHGDHQHPIDTSRAAVAQTMCIGTTAVAINRASAGLSLTGVSIDGNCAGSSGSCTGNAATATNAVKAGTKGTSCIQNPYVASTTTTVAHGLGAVPDYEDWYLECVIAEAGYTIGDRVKGIFGETNLNKYPQYMKNATNISYTSPPGAIGIMSLVTKAIVSGTNANWKVVVTPYRLQN